jgi:hypothetical protein
MSRLMLHQWNQISSCLERLNLDQNLSVDPSRFEPMGAYPV